MFDATYSPETSLPLPPPSGRPSWSGLLQFRLVGIPLKAFPAVRTTETSHFHQYHADCGQRIRYAKQCPVHGPVDAAAIAKGYEYGPQQHILLEPEDLDPLRPAQDRALRLERFVSPSQVDPLLFSGRGLHLWPDGPAAQLGYAVLSQALAQRQRWAVGRMVLGGHRQTVLVRAAGALLVAQLLHAPERVRASAAPSVPAGQDLSEEVKLASQLIDAASGGIDWSGYRDESAAELRALIEAKLQGQPAVADPGPVLLPLREALQQSVQDTKEPVKAPTPARKPTAAKRATANGSPAAASAPARKRGQRRA